MSPSTPSKLKDLTEHFIAGERVYDGVLLKVQRDLVRLPDGSEGTREYIRHPGAVAIVPVFDDGRVLLERQFRYPHRRVSTPPSASCSRRPATARRSGRGLA